MVTHRTIYHHLPDIEFCKQFQAYFLFQMKKYDTEEKKQVKNHSY